MLLKKSPIYIVLIVCLISIYMLFTIKENVAGIKGELIEINNQVQEETDKIHLLKAELAYLTSPSRLKALNDEYIKLSDTGLAQMDSEPTKNITADATSVVKRIARASGDVKWKYKRAPSKYVIMASGKK